MSTSKQIYFASDFHLGYPNAIESKKREKLIIEWLDSIKDDCQELFLLGDVFDFWYEYKSVVPKGNVRLLGKIAEFVDSGIPVTMFTGNHDQWLFGYLAEEIGVTILSEPLIKEFNGKKLFIHHGHALGSYDKGMNFLNKIFTNRTLQWLFARLHPNFAFGFARRWSAHNREKKTFEASNYLGNDREWLYLFANEVLTKEHYDYFIFGHRHVAMDKKLSEKSTLINTGNWISNTSYAVFDGKEVKTKIYKPELFPNVKIAY